MNLRDLAESNCGDSNALMNFSNHFVKDKAYKDQDLKQSTNNQFLESSTEELTQEFFSSVETDTFKMDSLLAYMRSVESGSHDDAWPSQLALTFNNQDHLFDPIIKSSSENEMIIDNEVHESAYSGDWLNKVEQSYQNQENYGTKSLFDIDKNKQNESYMQLTSDNNIYMPTNNSDLGLSDYIYDGKLFHGNQDILQNMSNGLGLGRLMNNKMNTGSPSTSGLGDSNLAKKLVSCSVLIDQMKEIANNNELEPPLYKVRSTEFEEVKCAERIKEYSFTPNNEKESIENPLAEGKQRLENGEFPTAVLCFEAAVKQNPSNAEAWQLLGTTQAENEQDQLAINALNKCIELQPDNLTAFLCLAVCYANEGYNLQSCHMLKEWLIQNPKYSDIAKSKPIQDSPDVMTHYMFTTKLYETVKDMYIKAAQRSMETGDMDADVQDGLGMLLTLNKENKKAVDCFKVALHIRPNDARLWNRLGATLANRGRREEAIESYRNALQLCPGFIRARFNLGITCFNLNSYREAIEHMLVALNQQASAVRTNFQSPILSDSIWSTLGVIISMTGRYDLLDAVSNRKLDLLNKKFNINEPK